MDVIFTHIPRPVHFLTDILNGSIIPNGASVNDRSFKVCQLKEFLISTDFIFQEQNIHPYIQSDTIFLLQVVMIIIIIITVVVVVVVVIIIIIIIIISSARCVSAANAISTEIYFSLCHCK
jgi:hypothetical protein